MRPLTPKNAVLAVVAVTVCALLGVAFDNYRGTGRKDARAAYPDAPPRSVAAPQSPLSPPSARADFDFYLLAMTLHESWCGDGNRGRKECRIGSDRPLVIHGLWPERLEPRTYPRD